MPTIKVLETNVLHVSDVIIWLDGSSAEATTDMNRVPHPLHWQLSQRPGDLQWRHSAGKTALWQRPAEPMINGPADTADKTFSAGPGFTISGVIEDPKQFFNPRLFSLTAGASDVPVPGQPVPLYPSPLGTRFGSAGGLIANLRFNATGDPVPWALLTLSVSVPGGTTQTYRAQADARGDVLIPLQRLPPLPEGIEHYNAQLAVRALADADPGEPVNPDDLEAVELESLTTPGSFVDPIGLQVVPGEIQLIRSASQDHLAVQPS